jgi:hypothetical protein
VTKYAKLTREFDTQMDILSSLRRERERLRSAEGKQQAVVSRIRDKISKELAKRDKS